MSDYYKTLPEGHDFDALAQAVIAIILDLRNHKNVEVIAKDMARALGHTEVNAAAIRRLLSRRGQTRFNRTNKTIGALYDFIIADRGHFPPEIAQKILSYGSVLLHAEDSDEAFADVEKSVGNSLRAWLFVSRKEIRRLGDKLVGEYVMLRNSLHNENVIVKSSLKIERNARLDQLTITHRHIDSQGVERTSRGFLLPLFGNIYGVLRVERGQGLETIALREPIPEHFKKMVGFVTSIDMDRNVLTSRVCIDKVGPEWAKIGPRFKSDAYANNTYVHKMISLLDKFKARRIPRIGFEEIEDLYQI